MEQLDLKTRLQKMSRQVVEDHLIWCAEQFWSYAAAFELEADRLQEGEPGTAARYRSAAAAYRHAETLLRDVTD